MRCTYCHTDPGAKKNGLWCGFRDMDTGELVCWQCRPKHYKTKFSKPEAQRTYSEVPVSAVEPQLNLIFQK
jgi:hypothetical protein